MALSLLIIQLSEVKMGFKKMFQMTCVISVFATTVLAATPAQEISNLFEKADKNLVEVYNGDYECVNQNGLAQKAHLEKKSKLVELRIENKNLKSENFEIRQDFEGQTGRTRTLIKNTASQEYYSCHYAI